MVITCPFLTPYFPYNELFTLTLLILMADLVRSL